MAAPSKLEKFLWDLRRGNMEIPMGGGVTVFSLSCCSPGYFQFLHCGWVSYLLPE